MSLTPSPVIATVFPCFLRACTSNFFCSGLTLPKTVNLLAASITSSSLIPSRLTHLLAFSIPTLRATSDTVTGLSPDITFTSTPLSLKYSIVSLASSRIWSSISIRAINLGTRCTLPSFTAKFECAKQSTRNPLLA